MNSVWHEEYDITRTWNNDYAEYRYELRQKHTLSGGPLEDATSMKTIATGDWGWAKRNAQHYGIKMPKEDYEETR